MAGQSVRQRESYVSDRLEQNDSSKELRITKRTLQPRFENRRVWSCQVHARKLTRREYKRASAGHCLLQHNAIQSSHGS
jgi:hypothetical protein